MSFESKMKKRGNQKLDKFAKNPYHKSWFSKIPIWTKVLVPSALAAGLIVGVFFGVLPNMTSKSTAQMKVDGDNVPASFTPASEPGKGDYSRAPTDASAPSSAQQASAEASNLAPSSGAVYIKHWDERTVIEKYNGFIYEIDGAKSRYYWYNNPPISIEAIDTKLEEDFVITGHDFYEDKDYETTVSIYTVKDFAPRLILAAKFEEDGNYYCFGSNATFNPYATIEEMLVDLPLAKIAAFNEAFLGYEEDGKRVSDKYSGVDKEVINNFINENSGAKNPNTTSELDGVIKTYNQYDHVISIPTPFPTINIVSGTGSSGLTFYDNGFVMATMLNRNYLFYIGKDSYQELEDYLKNNLVGVRETSYHPFSIPVNNQ